MRIAYIGNFIPERSTENALLYAFRKLGHAVLPIQVGDAPSFEFFYMDEGHEPPDVVLYTRTHNHTALPPSFTDIWRGLEDAGIRTASFHLDVFAGVHRHGMPENWWTDPLFTTGTVFTPDPLLSTFINNDRTEHVWLPPGCDVRDGDREGVPIDGLKGKVVFVGSRYGTATNHPEYPFRAQLLDWLTDRYRLDFYWYGPGAAFGPLRGPSLWDVYVSDCVVVGDSCFAGYRPGYWSDRVPETLARGGMLVHPYVDRILDEYPWRRAPWYEPGNLEELGHAIDAYRAVVTVPETGSGTARRLDAEKTRAQHSYVRRAEYIVDYLSQP